MLKTRLHFFAPIIALVLPLAGLISVCAVSAETLQVGIEHAEYLPSIAAQSEVPSGDRTLLPGRATRYGAGVQENGQNQPPPRMVEWFQIPVWMAGTWSKQGDTTISATDLHSGYTQNLNQWTDNRMTVAFGHQIDRSGTIWQANILPAETDSMSGAKSVKFFATARKCERVNQQELVTRTHYIITESFAGTGQVVDQFQQESLNDYTICPDGRLLNRSSNRVFTYGGRPVRDGNLESKFSKLAPFAVKQVLDGVDLNETFKSFLLAQGRPDLVP